MDTDKSIKMVVTDLDGTLLRDDKSVSEYTEDVFLKLKENDFYIVFATARPERGIEVPGIVPDAVIANNGALVKCSDEVIYNKLLPFSTCKELIKLFTSNDIITGITVETNNIYLTNCSKEEFDDVEDFWNPIFTDFDEIPVNNICKLGVQTEKREALLDITQDYTECTVMTCSGLDWHILTHKEATKLRAVEALTSYYGLNLDNVIAFGDDYNDLELMKGAGIGVAVSNAIDEIKDAADYETYSNNDEGVAHFLDKSFLKN